MRTASAVGAETATITAAPIATVFCTISTETRHCRRDVGCGETAPATDDRRGVDRLSDRLDAADAAACGARDLAPPFGDALGAW